jgi:uncharacterized damage-inducible protein DinB
MRVAGPLLDELTMEQARSSPADLNDERALATWRLVAGERELLAATRAAMLRSLLFNHWYHHREQLVVCASGCSTCPFPPCTDRLPTRIRL